MKLSAPNRNDPCPCGSGKKYKKCCLGNAETAQNLSPQAAKPKNNDVNATNSTTPSNLLLQAVALHQAGKLDEAGEIYQKLLAKNPHDSHALHYLGLIEFQRANYREAVNLIERAIRIDSHVPAFHCNLGNAFKLLGQHDSAIAAYLRAVQLDPKFQAAHFNLGGVYSMLGKLEEASSSYRKALSLSPYFSEAFGELFYTQLRCCDWSQYTSSIDRIVAEITEGKHGYAPFQFLSISQCSSFQLQCARTHVASKYPPSKSPLWTGQRYQHDRIRLAYVSADFCEHPVSFLMTELLEMHDRQRFEVIAISLRPEDKSATGQRVKAAFDKFVDVSRMNDIDVAKLMREMEIDIAVDLMGFTQYGRTGIFAHRPAPVQVNYLGYPGTMGAKYIDYIIGDEIVIPRSDQCYFQEKIVYLPNSFMPRDASIQVGDIPSSRLSVGLPEKGFVFCCFNNAYKFNPPMFDIWMRLLSTVTGSVLWLPDTNPLAVNNLIREAEKRGVDVGRIIFAKKTRHLQDHLARLTLADLFLDTLPYNAHTTANDALWAGLPVLTCVGNAFAGRVAASLLTAIGLPEMISHSMEEYEAMALKYSTTPALLAEIRNKLAKNRTTHPLFDSKQFRCQIESAYVRMWDQFQRGELPSSFTSPAITN